MSNQWPWWLALVSHFSNSSIFNHTLDPWKNNIKHIINILSKNISKGSRGNAELTHSINKWSKKNQYIIYVRLNGSYIINSPKYIIFSARRKMLAEQIIQQTEHVWDSMKPKPCIYNQYLIQQNLHIGGNYKQAIR